MQKSGRWLRAIPQMLVAGWGIHKPVSEAGISRNSLSGPIIYHPAAHSTQSSRGIPD